MHGQFEQVANPLNLSAPAEEIWNILILAAADSRHNALSLGKLLSQVSAQREHWLSKLGCASLQEFAKKLGITDRKFRHLVSLSDAFEDACTTLALNLQPPKNNLLASQLYLMKASLGEARYVSFLQRLYLGDEPSLAISNELARMKAEWAAQSKISPRARSKSRKAFLDVASMICYDAKIAEAIGQASMKLEESAKENVVAALADLIELLEQNLEQPALPHKHLSDVVTISARQTKNWALHPNTTN